MLGLAPAGSGKPMGTGIGAAAETRGLRFGTAVRADRLDDLALRAATVADSAWITPEIDFKWDALQPGRERWDWGRGDAVASFAAAHGKGLRGHTLLWEQSTPPWARHALKHGQGWQAIEPWFAGVLGRYGAQASEWDVVNEAIDTEHGTNDLRRTVFRRALGEGYVAEAFRLAREHAPKTRLILNDYGFEYGNPVDRARRLAFLRLAARLKGAGVPIDGVGLQAHLDLGKGPLDTAGIAEMIREVAAMELSVTITELDVREADRSGALATRDRAVADEVRRYLDAVLAEPGVTGVVTWGLTDRDSWLQDRPGPMNRGLPLDAALRPKPIYWTLRDAFA